MVSPALDSDVKRAPRTFINLGRLPPWLQTLIALAVVALVAGLAWWVRRDQPPAAWITDRIVPVLGWLFILLAVIAAVAGWRRRRTNRHPTRGGTHDPR